MRNNNGNDNNGHLVHLTWGGPKHLQILLKAYI